MSDPATPAAPGEISQSGLLTSNYEVAVTLADQQLDPNSPLYSVKTFEELGLCVFILYSRSETSSTP
jgi:ATP-dependent RNA helicase DDX19/DBP5